MFSPEAAGALVQAGGWTILVFLVGTIFATGAREVWVWGSTLRRALAENVTLRGENEKLRATVDANTAAMGTMSAAFVKSLDDLGGRFDQLAGIVINDVRTTRSRTASRRGKPGA